MDEQKGLNDNISPLTEQQRKYLGFLRDKVGEEKYLSIKTQVLGGIEYTSVEDGSKVIEALKIEVDGKKESGGTSNRQSIESQSQEARKEGKSLDERAIDIKGKKYILVADRIEYFNKKYPNGSINTEILTDLKEDILVIKAFVFPDIKKKERFFTGHARVNFKASTKSEPLEDSETSAVGRALGIMGIGLYGSVASAENIFDLEEGDKK